MMDDTEYNRFLSKLFPSRHMSKKVREMEKIDKIIDEKKRKRKKKEEVIEEETTDEESSEESEMDVDDSDEEDFGSNQKINIVFTIGDGLEYDETEDEEKF